MNPRVLRHPMLPRGVLAASALAAFILLMVFYSVVSGAVTRAETERRAAIQLQAAAKAAADARFAPRPVVAVQAQPRLAQRYAPRPVAYRSAQ